MNTLESLKSVPDHVPADIVVDYDIYDLPDSEIDPQLAWRCFFGKGPLVYCWKNGGHWVPTEAKTIAKFYRDTDNFSSSKVLIPQPDTDAMLPIQADPPEHSQYRANVQVLLTPERVANLESSIRQLAIDLIEDFRYKGECNFVADFALKFPLIIFLRMMALPIDDRDSLREIIERFNYNPDLAVKIEAHEELNVYLETWLQRKIYNPDDGAVSHLTRCTVNGRPYTRVEMLSTFMLLLQAGLDTVAMMLSFIAIHLAKHPEDRKFIRENDDRMLDIIQELMRRYAGPNMSRVLANDYVHEGVLMKKGEMIILPATLYNLDETLAENPEVVDFNREVRHITLGTGPHTCAGALLARKEITIFLQEFLGRIPDFELDPDRPVVMRAAPQNNVSSLWLKWMPPQRATQ